MTDDLASYLKARDAAAAALFDLPNVRAACYVVPKESTVTDDLAAYLLARLDAAAAEADEVHTFNCGAHEDDITGYRFVVTECDCGEPERIRADVAVKRRIVEAAQAAFHEQAPGSGSYDSESAQAVARSGAYDDVLRLMAQPYADRDDFKDLWRV